MNEHHVPLRQMIEGSAARRAFIRSLSCVFITNAEPSGIKCCEKEYELYKTNRVTTSFPISVRPEKFTET